MNEISFAYGKAIYEIALEHNLVSDYLTQIEIVEGLLDQELDKFLKAPSIDNDTKKEVLIGSLKGFDPYMLNFLSLIIDKKKQRYFKGIFEAYKSLAFEYLNIVVVKVFSAKKLEEVEKNKIIEGLKKKDSHKTYRIENILDKSLLAGYKLVLHQQVIDTSLKKRINLLKEELMKEGD